MELAKHALALYMSWYKLLCMLHINVLQSCLYLSVTHLLGRSPNGVTALFDLGWFYM